MGWWSGPPPPSGGVDVSGACPLFGPRSGQLSGSSIFFRRVVFGARAPDEGRTRARSRPPNHPAVSIAWLTRDGRPRPLGGDVDEVCQPVGEPPARRRPGRRGGLGVFAQLWAEMGHRRTLRRRARCPRRRRASSPPRGAGAAQPSRLAGRTGGLRRRSRPRPRTNGGDLFVLASTQGGIECLPRQ
jgi:hypothetical protein